MRTQKCRKTGFDRARLARGTAVVAVLVVCAAALSLMPGCGDSLSEARTLEERGDLNGAVTAYEKVLKLEPDSSEALVGEAVCLMTLGRFNDALPLQERAVAGDPRDVQIRLELGFNYLNHQDRPRDAVRVLAEAAALEASAKNLGFLAQAQMASGENQAAEQTLRRAIDHEPSYVRTYTLLVALLNREGRAQEARRLVDEAAMRGVVIEQPS